MPEVTHTPGPWFVGTGRVNDDEIPVCCEPNGTPICGVLPLPNAQADARLIAEAPGLLGLARELLSYEREAFDDDDEIDGGDLVDWFTDFRDRVHSVVRRIEGKAVRAPTTDPLLIQSLIAQYGSAQFDCGEWAHNESDEPYEDVSKRATDALLKLHAALGLREPDLNAAAPTEYETALTVTFAPECNLQDFVASLHLGGNTLAINGQDCRLRIIDTHFGLHVQPLDDDGNNAGGQKRIPWDDVSRIHVY